MGSIFASLVAEQFAGALIFFPICWLLMRRKNGQNLSINSAWLIAGLLATAILAGAVRFVAIDVIGSKAALDPAGGLAIFFFLAVPILVAVGVSAFLKAMATPGEPTPVNQSKSDLSGPTPLMTSRATTESQGMTPHSAIDIQPPEGRPQPASNTIDVRSSTEMGFDERGALTRIAEEIERQQVDKGLWLKALMEADGDLSKQALVYAKLRLADEADKQTKMVQQRLQEDDEDRAATLSRKAEREKRRQRDGPVITTMKDRLASGEELFGFNLNVLVEHAVQHAEDLDEPLTPQRETLLHIAAKKNFWRAAEALIRHGASLNATDASGRTPLEVAERNEAHIVASMLMDAQSAHSNARQHLKNPVNAFEYCRQRGIAYSRVEELISAGKLPAYRSPKVLLVDGAVADVQAT